MGGMDLAGGQPFWSQHNGVPETFPRLTGSIDTDIVIIGGGITGALLADAFARQGLQVTVVDRRRIAHGSTRASTALLQYEIDIPLSRLSNMIGIKNATRAYQLCGEAISSIAAAAARYEIPEVFAPRPSLYLAADAAHLPWLRTELEARRQAGFEVSFLSREQLRDEYHIEAEGAIHSKLGGELDPYVLTYTILSRLQAAGHNVFERTEVTSIETQGQVRLRSKNGALIKARRLIFATGYESQEYLQEQIVELTSSYALVSGPLGPQVPWKDAALLWDTADPYLYARTTTDGRVLLGGGDVRFHNRFMRDLLLPWKTRQLVNKFQRYVPDLEPRVAYRWSGTFGMTKDGLAYIGESPEWPNAYFALGFGGNGITFSAVAADLLVRSHQGQIDPDLSLFRFGR